MRDILVILVLIALVVALAGIMNFGSGKMENLDAKKVILEDLQTKYPNADKYEILEMREMANMKGDPYSQVKAQVTIGLASKCPERVHIYYNYPEQSFEAYPPEYITRGCKVCQNVDKCIIAFPEEAVIASHYLDLSGSVMDYINTNNAYPEVSGFENTWIVLWRSQKEPTMMKVTVSKDGKILGKEIVNN